MTQDEKNAVIRVLRSVPFTKIVLMNCLNNFNTESMLAEIAKYCSHFSILNQPPINSNNEVYHYPYFVAEFDGTRFPQLKSTDRYLFINCPRHSETFLDYAKVADILLNISTVEHADLQKLNVSPSEAVNAIDELGENMINLLRSQGCLKTLNAVVGWDKVHQSKYKDLKFYFKRLLEEDFPDSKTQFLQQDSDLIKLLIDLQNLGVSNFEWRKDRGYFLVDKVEFSNEDGLSKRVYLSGHLKNNFTTDELVHITGVGDFKIESISGMLSSKADSIMMMKPCTSPHPFELFSTDPANIIKEVQRKLKRRAYNAGG